MACSIGHRIILQLSNNYISNICLIEENIQNVHDPQLDHHGLSDRDSFVKFADCYTRFFLAVQIYSPLFCLSLLEYLILCIIFLPSLGPNPVLARGIRKSEIQKQKLKRIRANKFVVQSG